MSNSGAVALLVVIVLGAPGWAAARSTMYDLDADEALASELGKEKLLAVRVYLSGRAHGEVAADLGVFATTRVTNAFNKADEEACRIAFLSAVIVLQERALEAGGNAVVDIKSITKGRHLDSETQYRCAAGNVVANVALSGRVVRIDD